MSDGELVTAVLGGDSAAFETLYRLHVRAVARVIRDQCHAPEDVTDLVQETFLRALERLGTLRERDRFRPWLLSIAQHAAIDQRRSTNRRITVNEDDVEGELPLKQAGPDEMAELRELARLVSGCLAALSTRDATAVALVSHLDFSHADVAAALGVSPGAAKVLVHRARRRLREALTLELMVRRRGAGCEPFAALYDLGRLRDAARHVRTCAACAGQLRSDITLYGPPLTVRTVGGVHPLV